MTDAERELCFAALAFHDCNQRLTRLRASMQAEQYQTENVSAEMCERAWKEQKLILELLEAERIVHLEAECVLKERSGG